MSPYKGKGEKELDGSIRNYPVYCRLPLWKVKLIDKIANDLSISRTDIISSAIDLWLKENSIYTEESVNINTKN